MGAHPAGGVGVGEGEWGWWVRRGGEEVVVRVSGGCKGGIREGSGGGWRGGSRKERSAVERQT